MTYYLHRISHHAELAHPLLERGILSIGWSYFATPEFVSRHRAKEWKEVPGDIEQEWGKIRSRFGLQRFLQMNKGDRIVVPSWGTFHVYDVDSDERLIADDLDLHDLKTWHSHAVRREKGHLYIEDKDGQLREGKIDLGFFRKVKLVAKDIPRSGYADKKLIARLKVRQTNVKIDDIRKSVDEAIDRWEEKTPINIADSITNSCAGEVLRLINKELSPARLEKLIKWYFERIGASSVDIPAKNERGKEGDADIVATFEPIGTIVYVQAKYHKGTTGNWAVEQIDSYVKNKEELGAEDGYTRIPWVISTGDDFSQDCRKEAERHHVCLIDGKELATRILEAGISDLELK